MNWYFYWFYTIFDIYKRFSSDKDFVLFAIGMFTFIQGFLITGLIDLLFIYLHLASPLHYNNYTLPIIGGGLFIINCAFFIPNGRQTKYYNAYKKTHSRLKDTIAILVSILSVLLFFIAMVKLKSSQLA